MARAARQIAAATPITMTVPMKLGKITPGAVRYETEGNIHSHYFRRKELADWLGTTEVPKTLTIRIDVP